MSGNIFRDFFFYLYKKGGLVLLSSLGRQLVTVTFSTTRQEVIMYYRRFATGTFEFALALETITHEQYQRILDLYEHDSIVIKGIEGVEFLQSVVPDVTVTQHKPEQDLYFVHIDRWPHLKYMCLKFASKNPCRFIYVEEMDDERVLFEYHLDTCSIFGPPSIPHTDGIDSTVHGSD